MEVQETVMEKQEPELNTSNKKHTVNLLEITSESVDIAEIVIAPSLVEILVKDPVCGRSDYSDLPGVRADFRSPWRSFAEFPRRLNVHQRSSHSLLSAEERFNKNYLARIRREKLTLQRVAKRERYRAQQRERSRQQSFLKKLQNPASEKDAVLLNPGLILSSPSKGSPRKLRKDNHKSEIAKRQKGSDSGQKFCSVNDIIKSIIDFQEKSSGNISLTNQPETFLDDMVSTTTLNQSAKKESHSFKYPTLSSKNDKATCNFLEESEHNPVSSSQDSSTNELPDNFLMKPASGDDDNRSSNTQWAVSSTTAPEIADADSSTPRMMKRKTRNAKRVDYTEMLEDDYDDIEEKKHFVRQSKTSGRKILPVKRTLEQAIVSASMKRSPRKRKAGLEKKSPTTPFLPAIDQQTGRDQLIDTAQPITIPVPPAASVEKTCSHKRKPSPEVKSTPNVDPTTKKPILTPPVSEASQISKLKPSSNGSPQIKPTNNYLSSPVRHPFPSNQSDKNMLVKTALLCQPNLLPFNQHTITPIPGQNISPNLTSDVTSSNVSNTAIPGANNCRAVLSEPLGRPLPVLSEPLGRPLPVLSEPLGRPLPVLSEPLGRPLPVLSEPLGRPLPVLSEPLGRPLPVLSEPLGRPLPALNTNATSFSLNNLPAFNPPILQVSHQFPANLQLLALNVKQLANSSFTNNINQLANSPLTNNINQLANSPLTNNINQLANSSLTNNINQLARSPLTMMSSSHLSSPTTNSIDHTAIRMTATKALPTLKKALEHQTSKQFPPYISKRLRTSSSPPTESNKSICPPPPLISISELSNLQLRSSHLPQNTFMQTGITQTNFTQNSLRYNQTHIPGVPALLGALSPKSRMPLPETLCSFNKSTALSQLVAQNSTVSTSYSTVPTAYSTVPTSYSTVPTAYSTVPTPYSTVPTLYSTVPQRLNAPTVRTSLAQQGISQTKRQPKHKNISKTTDAQRIPSPKSTTQCRRTPNQHKKVRPTLESNPTIMQKLQTPSTTFQNVTDFWRLPLFNKEPIHQPITDKLMTRVARCSQAQQITKAGNSLPSHSNQQRLPLAPPLRPPINSSEKTTPNNMSTTHYKFSGNTSKQMCHRMTVQSKPLPSAPVTNVTYSPTMRLPHRSLNMVPRSAAIPSHLKHHGKSMPYSGAPQAAGIKSSTSSLLCALDLRQNTSNAEPFSSATQRLWNVPSVSLALTFKQNKVTAAVSTPRVAYDYPLTKSQIKQELIIPQDNEETKDKYVSQPSSQIFRQTANTSFSNNQNANSKIGNVPTSNDPKTVSKMVDILSSSNPNSVSTKTYEQKIESSRNSQQCNIPKRSTATTKTSAVSSTANEPVMKHVTIKSEPSRETDENRDAVCSLVPTSSDVSHLHRTTTHSTTAPTATQNLAMHSVSTLQTVYSNKKQCGLVVQSGQTRQAGHNNKTSDRHTRHTTCLAEKTNQPVATAPKTGIAATTSGPSICPPVYSQVTSCPTLNGHDTSKTRQQVIKSEPDFCQTSASNLNIEDNTKNIEKTPHNQVNKKLANSFSMSESLLASTSQKQVIPPTVALNDKTTFVFQKADEILNKNLDNTHYIDTFSDFLKDNTSANQCTQPSTPNKQTADVSYSVSNDPLFAWRIDSPQQVEGFSLNDIAVSPSHKAEPDPFALFGLSNMTTYSVTVSNPCFDASNLLPANYLETPVIKEEPSIPVVTLNQKEVIDLCDDDEEDPVFDSACNKQSISSSLYTQEMRSTIACTVQPITSFQSLTRRSETLSNDLPQSNSLPSLGASVSEHLPPTNQGQLSESDLLQKKTPTSTEANKTQVKKEDNEPICIDDEDVDDVAFVESSRHSNNLIGSNSSGNSSSYPQAFTVEIASGDKSSPFGTLLSPEKNQLTSRQPGRILASVASWTDVQVTEWLKLHKFDKICPNLSSLDGRGLQRMAFEHQRDPDMFYRRVKTTLGLTFFQTMVICQSMKELHENATDDN